MIAQNPYHEELSQIVDEFEHSAALVSIRKWAKDRGIVLDMPTDKQARVLIDAFYNIQELRKRSANQIRASGEAQEPCDTLVWLNRQNTNLETFIKTSLALYVESHKIGQWLSAVYGIGPVLAAGLLAHIDIHKAPTVGHLWQYCGIAGAGQKKWAKNTKRPWNAFLKTLCFKIGDCFIKFHNHPDCVYGHLYAQRKQREVSKNDTGDFAAQAMLEADKKSKDSEAWPWNNACYPGGTTAAALALPDIDKRSAYLKTVRGAPGSGLPMLHLGHVNDRARRYAVKQFLADLHAVWYRAEFGKEPPLPYPIAILGHAHLRAVPPERTDALERAARGERTEVPERAATGERTEVRERAGGIESTGSVERAEVRESAELNERAGLIERTSPSEREPPKPECTVIDERAVSQEGTEIEERAGKPGALRAPNGTSEPTPAKEPWEKSEPSRRREPMLRSEPILQKSIAHF